MTNPEATASSEMELDDTELSITVTRMFQTERGEERRRVTDDERGKPTLKYWK